MNMTLEILVLGLPLILSLAWFVFWVIRILLKAKKLKKNPPAPHSTPAPDRRSSSPAP
jgi:uncharacterized protein YneF (UPF0154 family)